MRAEKRKRLKNREKLPKNKLKIIKADIVKEKYFTISALFLFTSMKIDFFATNNTLENER